MKHIIVVSLIGMLLASAADAATGEIVTEAIVNAPVDEAWKAWTTADGMQTWMVGKADIDLRVGGSLPAVLYQGD